MSKDYRVNTFGLTDEENTLVEESLPTRAYELYIADTPTDDDRECHRIRPRFCGYDF